MMRVTLSARGCFALVLGMTVVACDNSATDDDAGAATEDAGPAATPDAGPPADGGDGCPACGAHGTCDEASGVCECEAGYGGAMCGDIDECEAATDTCDELATCANTEGGFTCTCPSGYDDTSGDGTECADTDECGATPIPCDEAATCANTEGSFTCTCPSGYDDTSGDGTECTDIDECAGEPDCAGSCVNTPGTFECHLPASCAEIRAALPTATDGEYTLFIAGDAEEPFAAYCHDMTGTPREYLTLLVTDAANFAQYTAGGASPGTNVRTSYARIRIDPATLVVDTGDQTFATSTGSLSHSSAEPVSSMPYAVAMTCTGGAAADGVANIDLTGLPFAVDDTFCMPTGGSSPLGTVTRSSDDRVLDITANGYCGWTAPEDGPNCPYNPINARGGPILNLVYVP